MKSIIKEDPDGFTYNDIGYQYGGRSARYVSIYYYDRIDKTDNYIGYDKWNQKFLSNNPQVIEDVTRLIKTAYSSPNFDRIRNQYGFNVKILNIFERGKIDETEIITHYVLQFLLYAIKRGDSISIDGDKPFNTLLSGRLYDLTRDGRQEDKVSIYTFWNQIKEAKPYKKYIKEEFEKLGIKNDIIKKFQFIDTRESFIDYDVFMSETGGIALSNFNKKMADLRRQLHTLKGQIPDEYLKQIGNMDENIKSVLNEVVRLNSINEINDIVKKNICIAVQKIYDDWEVGEDGYSDEYGVGGICHLIADEIVNVLDRHNISRCTTVSSTHEVHVYVVGQFREGVYLIDIPYWEYETGGGYNWKKIPGVTFTPNYITISKLDSNPRRYSMYLDER